MCLSPSDCLWLCWGLNSITHHVYGSNYRNVRALFLEKKYTQYSKRSKKIEQVGVAIKRVSNSVQSGPNSAFSTSLQMQQPTECFGLIFFCLIWTVIDYVMHTTRVGKGERVYSVFSEQC